MRTVRRHIVFSGYVQGVGFRYHAKYKAEALGLTGYVRNCSDGSVEMEAEGDEQSVYALIAAMREHVWGSVDNVEIENVPVQDDRYFDIR